MSIKEALQKKLKGLRVGNDLNYLERLSTGIAPLDAAIGGGLPLRRVVQIYGPPSVGKSLMALSITRHVQQQDPTAEAIYIDMEATVTKSDIEELNLDGNRILFYNAMGGEDAYDSALDALEAGAKIAVIDSIPFLRPKAVLEAIDKDSEYRDVSSIALLMERVQSKIVHTLAQSDGVLIFINQERPKKSKYEAPTYPGGSALQFLLSVNIQIGSCAKGGKDGNDPSLMTQKILIRKNKTFVPMQKAEIPYYNRLPMYGSSLIEVASNTGLIIKGGGGNYSLSEALAEELKLDSPKLGRGIDKVGPELEANKELYDLIYSRTIAEICSKPPAPEIEEELAGSIYDN